MDASISIGAEKLSCGMSEMDACPKSANHSNEDSLSRHSCCDQGSCVLSADDELRNDDLSINNFTYQFIIAFITSTLPTITEKEVRIQAESPPPLTCKQPYYILHCSYLI